jgi:hypothetical protein
MDLEVAPAAGILVVRLSERASGRQDGLECGIHEGRVFDKGSARASGNEVRSDLLVLYELEGSLTESNQHMKCQK